MQPVQPEQQPMPAPQPPFGAPLPPPVAAQPPRRGSTTLPWVLVALLTALTLALTMALGWRTNQVTKLRSERDAAAGQSAAPQQGQQAQRPRITPQPTTGERAEEILKLATRTPGDPMAKGRPDAPLVMIEWADYRCPFCAKFSLETRPQLQPYIDSGSLRIEFRDLVIFGDESMLAARGARAAGNQGKYFEFAEAIWRIHTGQGHPTVDQAVIEAAAAKAGIKDMAKFTADLNDPAIAAAIQADTTQAQQLGINATPFFLVNTTPVSGALPASDFIALLEASGAKRK